MSEKSTPSTSAIGYADAGVDIDAGNRLVDRIKQHVSRTHRPEVMTELGGFGGLFQLDLDRFRHPVLVSGTDGVGTKLLLARRLDRHDTIGIDLVAMCVNDILAQGAEPLFFLDYFATGKLDEAQAEAVIAGIASGCEQAGCALIGGETAEMPGVYGAGEYDLAGFTVGAVDRDRIIDGSRIQAGHRLLGLPSSGPHSNGYSLIRKIIDDSGASLEAPVPGSDDDSTPLGDALIAPTRIYVSTILQLLESHRIDGIAHITGGGLSENIVRVLDPELGISIDLTSWQWPAVFDWIAETGPVEGAEMLKTFNCGIGLVLAVPADQAENVTAALSSLGEAAVMMGRVVNRDENPDQKRVHYSNDTRPELR